ncbi:MAG: TonB-dependent receptor [Chitinophagales bacterium]|nr:TonB-dependent receptor [Chitinophagales bacterium]MDW8392667.1 TonB-dependent receptor [Chitinophagales bacterium]
MHLITRILTFFFFIFFSAAVTAQQVSGRVYGRDSLGIQVPLSGVLVTETRSGLWQLTDADGRFELTSLGSPPYLLVFSHAGYAPDTLATSAASVQMVLRKVHVLSGVEVDAADRSTTLSLLNVRPTEIITRSQLESTACCNLSESFEANATVDASFSDAVTGFRQIRMLGLAGRYAQLLTEAVPTLRGLAGTIGLSHFPGTWLKTISVSKGTGSVVNGYDAITGQINVELFRPDSADVFFVNGYANSEQRYELNLHTRQQVTPSLSHLLLTHGAMMRSHMDVNGDYFLDQPVSEQLMLMDRWLLQHNEQVEVQFGIKGIYDNRWGGSVHFHPETDKLGDLHYGTGMTIRRAEAFAKAALLFPGKPYQSLGLQLFGTVHDQQGYYGLRQYSGKENQLFGNLIFSSVLGSTMHKYKAGLSWLWDDKRERFADLVQDRRQSVPGAFAEYTYNDEQHWTVVAGMRADWHNLYGMQVSPRIHMRYAPAPFTTLRLSTGTGFRVAEPLMDNSGYLASSRTLIIAPDLQLEKAWTSGIGLVQEARWFGRDFSFLVDVFRTQFLHQVVVDADSNPSELRLYNLNGRSYSHVAQAEIGICPMDGLELRFSYRYNEVRLTIGDRLREQPYTPRHRAVAFAHYTTPNKRWSGTFISQWVGSQRLPDTQANPEPYRMPERSEPYVRLIAQVQHTWKNWEFYVGSENMTNAIQQNRIIAPDDPFGPYFDASFVWGPLSGRMFYAGLRFALKGESVQ